MCGCIVACGCGCWKEIKADLESVADRLWCNLLCGESAEAAGGEIVGVDNAQVPRVPRSSGHAKTPLHTYKAHAERHTWLRPFPTNDAAERNGCYGRSAMKAACAETDRWLAADVGKR